MYTTLLAVALAAVNQAPGLMPPSFRVNCDLGQSLALALRRAEWFPGATVQIRGTCRGSFVVKTDGLRLIGDSPQQSSLAPSADNPYAPLLEVRDARNVYVRGLGFHEGYAGIQFERSPGGTIVDSEFWNNGLAVYYRQLIDGFVLNSSFHDNEVGLISELYSSVGVSGSELRDQRVEGAAAFRYSILRLIDSQVSGSGSAGATAHENSTLTLWNTTFEDNGEIHVFGQDRSTLNFISGIRLGSVADPTPFAAGIDADSSLRSGSDALFHGDISVSASSYLELAAVRVDGVIRADRFSRVALYSTDVTQPAVCETAADLVCGWTTVVATFGCPSAAESCTAPPSAPARPGGLPPSLDLRRDAFESPWAPALRPQPGATRD